MASARQLITRVSLILTFFASFAHAGASGMYGCFSLDVGVRMCAAQLGNVLSTRILIYSISVSCYTSEILGFRGTQQILFLWYLDHPVCAPPVSCLPFVCFFSRRGPLLPLYNGDVLVHTPSPVFQPDFHTQRHPQVSSKANVGNRRLINDRSRILSVDGLFSRASSSVPPT